MALSTSSIHAFKGDSFDVKLDEDHERLTVYLQNENGGVDMALFIPFDLAGELFSLLGAWAVDYLVP